MEYLVTDKVVDRNVEFELIKEVYNIDWNEELKNSYINELITEFMTKTGEEELMYIISKDHQLLYGLTYEFVNDLHLFETTISW